MKYLINKLKSFFLLFISNPIVWAEYKNGVMTVKYKRGQEEQFEGECTVWYKLPYMKRCGTFKEGQLCELWEFNKKWGGSFPDAYKNNI